MLYSSLDFLHNQSEPKNLFKCAGLLSLKLMEYHVRLASLLESISPRTPSINSRLIRKQLACFLSPGPISTNTRWKLCSVVCRKVDHRIVFVEVENAYLVLLSIKKILFVTFRGLLLRIFRVSLVNLRSEVLSGGTTLVAS